MQIVLIYPSPHSMSSPVDDMYAILQKGETKTIAASEIRTEDVEQIPIMETTQQKQTFTVQGGGQAVGRRVSVLDLATSQVIRSRVTSP